MSRFLTALAIALCVSIGFLIPDIMNDHFDRADIAAPLIAFGTSYFTILIKGY